MEIADAVLTGKVLVINSEILDSLPERNQCNRGECQKGSGHDDPCHPTRYRRKSRVIDQRPLRPDDWEFG